MPKRFVATEHAAEKGLANTTPAAGAGLVTDWIKELSQVRSPGAKELQGELQQLEKELKKDKPDASQVTKILGKIGPETVKLAKQCEDPAIGEKVRSLGEVLSQAAA